MKLFDELTIRFTNPDWSRNPELGVIDTILETHSNIFLLFEKDIKGKKHQNKAGGKIRKSKFGRGDVPSVEQIVRAAIYKEIKGMDYRELEYAQSDSRICVDFIKLDGRKPYSFQMFQKYISRIQPETLREVNRQINLIAIGAGYEDVKQVCQDTTIVKTNIITRPTTHWYGIAFTKAIV